MSSKEALAGVLGPSSYEALLTIDQAVLDAVPAAIYVCSAEGILVRFNRRAGELWGRTPRPGDTDERFCGAFRLYDQEGKHLPHASTPMAAVLRSGVPAHDKEVVIERPDGSRVAVLVNIEPLRSPEGDILGAINCFQDITANARAVTLEAAAEQARQQLASIVESSADAIVSKDLNGIIASWNQGAERLFGYSADEVIGKPITTLIPPDHQDEEPGILARIQRGERLEHYETVRLRKDGSLIDISLTVSPIKDAAGKIVGASKIARDITGRKRAEESIVRRLDEQAALYRFTDRLYRAESLIDVFDAGLDAILGALHCNRASILLFDDQGVMRFVAWRGLSDQYRRAVDGHSPWKPGARDPHPIVVDDIDLADEPESLKATIKGEGIRALAFIPLVANGVVIGKFMTYYETPHAFTDQEIELAVTIARQLCFSLERMRAEEARRLAEERLRRNEERLRLATQAGKIGLWDWDIPANHVSWTKSLYSIHGVEEDTFDATVQGFTALVHPDDRGRVSDAIQHSLKENVPYELEFRAVRPDGQIVWLFTNAIVLRDGGKPVRMVGATVDITDRKQAEERFRLAVEAAPSGMALADSEGRIVLVNAHAEKLFGYGREELVGQKVEMLVPERFRVKHPGFRTRYGKKPSARPMGAGRDLFALRKDGTEVPVEIGLSPIQTNEGLMVLSAIVDITERKRAESQRDLLVAELSHRVKNTLATVVSIAHQSFSKSPSVEEARRSFDGRIRALAQTHSRLAEANWSGVSFETLLLDELAPYRREDDGNVRVSGPGITFNPKSAVVLGMAFHELATNAAKHGSLSTKSGSVSVTWEIAPSNSEIEIRWIESGGPIVVPPRRSGFGRLLLERALASDLKGAVQLDFAEPGLQCVIALPLAEHIAGVQ